MAKSANKAPAQRLEEALSAKQLMERAIKQYPGVFSSEPGSIPLRLKINMEKKTESRTYIYLPLTILTLGFLMPGILPAPDWEKETMSVQWDAQEAGCGVPKDGNGTSQAESMAWVTLYTPLGLIPVPYKSETRMSITIFQNNRAIEFMLPIRQDCVIQALAKSLTSPDGQSEASARPQQTGG